MTTTLTNRRLFATAGRRNAELRAEPFEAPPPPPGCARVRNHLTLIHPCYDLERVAICEERSCDLELGRIAIGRVEAANDISGLAEGDWVYWNGPHSDYGLLDAARSVWTRVEGPDPRLLPAGIGAEAQAGIMGALRPPETDSTGVGGANAGTSAATPDVVFPERAIILGQGMLGHLGAAWLRSRGVEVTVVENSPKRLEFSKYHGLIQRIDTHNSDWFKRLEKYNPSGAGLIVDAASQYRTLGEVLPLLNPGGALCLLGRWRPELPASITDALGESGSRLVGPPAPFGESPAEQIPLLRGWLDMIREGKIPVDRILTTTSPADAAPLEVKRLATGVRSMLGVVLVWA